MSGGILVASLVLGAFAPVEAPFEWDVPAVGCPSAQQVRDDVARMLPALDEAAADLVRVHAEVTRAEDSTWALDLSIVTSRGRTESRLRASTCDTLAEATALFVALAIDPHGAVEHEPIATTPEEGEEGEEVDAGATIVAAEAQEEGGGMRVRTGTRERTPDSGRSRAPAEDRRAGAPRRRGPKVPLQWRLRVAGAGGLGILPSVRGAMGGGVALLTRYVRVDVQGAYWFRRRTPIEEAPGASTRTTAGVAAIRGCPFGRVRMFELGGCVGVEIGRFTVGSEGLLDPTPARVLWASVTGDLLVGWHPIERLTLALEPGVVFALHRPRFAAVGVGDILHTGPVGGRFGLALEIAL